MVAPGGRASQLASQRVFKSLCGMLQASTGGKSCLIRREAHTLLPTHLINNVQYASEDACTRAGDRSGAEGTVGPETGLCGPRGGSDSRAATSCARVVRSLSVRGRTRLVVLRVGPGGSFSRRFDIETASKKAASWWWLCLFRFEDSSKKAASMADSSGSDPGRPNPQSPQSCCGFPKKPQDRTR